MGETKIEWVATRNADGTVTPGYSWNPWIGCTRVSPGCVHCYAESFARRFGKAEWGPTAKRVRTSAANWKKPLLWNRQAEKKGVRLKVFCASLADVFEDHPSLAAPRTRLFEVIAETRTYEEDPAGLDWLLLTKRPENILRFVEWPEDIGEAVTADTPVSGMWFGTT